MKNLIILAHPDINNSNYNRYILNEVKGVPGTKVNNIYSLYKNFKIDAESEKKDLLSAERIIFQFPLLWYGEPSLLKTWEELVLSPDLCSGPLGDKLKGKGFSISVTGGGSLEEYERKGMNYKADDLWKPFIYLAKYCLMNFESIIYTRVPYISGDIDGGCSDEVKRVMRPHVDKMLELLRRPNVLSNKDIF
ncbi:NAD(P)H-dependent oxidoreductase [Serratia sp. N21D137]|uniref:NAD(P)H-dependent oxidoreductase n=1 Tax=Serratia sp. N21D137 TaxID=3397495 RepID=UPI0039DF965E